MRKIAVLTGDLIGSTESPPGVLEATMARLSAAAGEVAGWTGARSGPENTHFTRYRGDGWQMVVTDPALALRAALFLLARLRAGKGLLDSRIAIGIGAAESLGSAGLSDARGAAFEASGRGLDGIGRQRQLAVAGEGVTALHEVIVDLLEEHARHWTREQAEAAALWLDPANPTLADVAPRLGISPQAVNYRLSGGSVQAIRRALAGWEAGFAEAEGRAR